MITQTKLSNLKLNRPGKILKKCPKRFLINKNMNPEPFSILKTFLENFVTGDCDQSRSLERNKKKLTLCLNNKKMNTKFCNFGVNIIVDTFSNMSVMI